MTNRISFAAAALVAFSLAGAPEARAAAAVLIINGNAPGIGFNDPSPVSPVGGNAGTTLGQQRLIAFQAAADIWGDTIDSPVPIRILATFESQTCTATSAVLGSAGSRFLYVNFPKVGLYPGPVANLLYGGALADKVAGAEIDPFEADGVTPRADIRARFNSNLNGSAACLGGRKFYLGLDANHGTDIDLVAVLLHEFAHGLGFQQFADVTSGRRPADFDDVFNIHIFDNTTHKFWNQMSDAERAASSINPRNVVFDGPAVNAAVPGVLAPGTPLLMLLAPAALAGIYQVGTAQFGPPLASPGVSGQIVVALDAANAAGPSSSDGCSAITNGANVAGRIALVDRGTCGFVVKAKNAQNAGAIGVIIGNNVAGGPPGGMAGVDPTITIPSVLITQADANSIKAQLAIPATVSGTLGVNLGVLAGADAHNFALLYSPNPVAPGSTISHWDTIAFPNQLMEPNINGDLTHSVKPPQDLTLPLLRDIGWFADRDLDGLADSIDQCPASIRSATVVIDGEDTGVANPMFTTGCTVADLVAAQSAGAANHGGFVSGVAHVANDLVAAGVITDAERSRIQRAAAHASHP
jgi:PA domain-containing protein